MTDRHIAHVVASRGAELPRRPEEISSSALAERATRGAAGAAARLADLIGAPDVLAASEGEAAATAARALSLVPGAHVSGRAKDDDGVDVVVEGEALTSARRADLVADGGGVVVARVEGALPIANRLAGLVAAATGAVGRAYVVLGSDPTSVLDTAAATALVIPLATDVIVQPVGGDPVDVPRGTAVRVDGWPRIRATGAAATLVVCERRFGSDDHRRVLAIRARHHPMLRVDLPIALDRSSKVYGSPEAISYLDLFAGEVESLVDAAPDGLLRWWWVLNHPLSPWPDGLVPSVVEGRVPGGVGVLGIDDVEDVLYLRAAATTLQVPVERLALVEQTLGGEAFTWDRGDASSVAALFDAGLLVPQA